LWRRIEMMTEMTLPQIIAHRGASAYAPENTLAAFKKARDLGSKWLEFDVVLSEDGTPFVFHDSSVKRTTNGKGKIAGLSCEYLKDLDAGSWFSKQFQGEVIPTLQQAIAFLARNKMQANIELKPTPGKEQETAVAVLSAINQYWPEDTHRPLVSSFNHQALGLVRTFDPDIPLGFLMDEWDDEGLKQAKEMDCVSIHTNFKSLNKARVKKAKNEGFKLLAYTVNNKKIANKLLRWGVDSVFSDYPDLLQ
jgi:glycerophosphoryl diester phosphodiesterase